MAVNPTTGDVYATGSYAGGLNAVYGTTFSATNGGTDAFLAKYNSVGTLQWALEIGGGLGDGGRSVALDPFGDVYITGFFNGTVDFDPSAATFNLVSSGGQDVFIAKYSAAGAFMWAVLGGGASTDIGYGIYADANGVYVTGAYLTSAIFRSTNLVTATTAAALAGNNMFVAKYALNGVVQWVASGGSNQADEGYDVTADANRVYVIGDYRNTFSVYNSAGALSVNLPIQASPNSDIFVVAYTQAGGYSWATNVSAANIDQGRGITNDGTNVYITGAMSNNAFFPNPGPVVTQTVTGGAGTDAFIAKLNGTTGVYQWVRQIVGSGTVNDCGQSVVYHPLGRVYVTGYYNTGLNFTASGGPNITAVNSTDLFVAAYTVNNGFYFAISGGGTGADVSYGLGLNNTADAYIGGSYLGPAFFGTSTLTAATNSNIAIAKCGCGTVLSLAAAGSDQTVCATTATMAANTPTNGTGTWSLLSGAGTINTPNSPSSGITGLALGANQFIWTISGSGCTVNRDTVRIWRELSPSISVAGPSQSVCATVATMAANTPTTGTGLWTLISGAGTITTPASPTSGITGLGIGANVFQWTISYLSCPPSISTMTITRYAPPTPANAGPNQTVCSTMATMAANTTSAGIGTWSLISGAGTITNANLNSTTITGLGIGANVFQWTTSNGACISSVSSVTVTKDAPPTPALAGPSQSVCATTATMAANTTSVGTGVWTLLSGSGTILNPNLNTTAITVLGVGTNIFQWQTSNGVCPPTTSTVSITRYAPPTISNAGPSQTICATSYTMSGNLPAIGTGSWTLVSGSGTISSPTSPTTAITGLAVGNNVFQWTISNGVCPVSSSNVTITVDANPTIANAGPNQTICSTTATLAGNFPAVGTGSWSLISGSATISTPSSSSSAITAIAAGTNIFQWSISNGVCLASTATVQILRDDFPTVSNAGVSTTVCSTNYTLSGNTPLVGSGNWTLLSGSGVLTTPSSPASGITGLGVGNNIFQWTISNGVCPSSSATVQITRDDFPTTANAGLPASVCATTATLTANSPTVGVGLWTLLSGSGTIAGINSPTTNVTALGVGANVFQWSITNGVCPASTATVLINRDLPPSVSVAGASQTVCALSGTLSANNPVIGVGAWTVISGFGTATAPNSATTTATGLGVGTNVFQWTISNGVCPVSSSTMAIVRDNFPTVALAGTSQSVCASTTTLSGNIVVVGTGLWTVITGTATIISHSSPTTTATGLSVGNNVFQWTISNGVCPPTSSTVSVTQYLPPTVANAGPSQTVCATTATMNANTPSVGTGTWTLLSGTGTITSPNSPVTNITGLGVGVNIFRWGISNGVCTVSNSTVSIVRDDFPTAANAGASQTICATTATLTGNTPTVGTGLWSLVSGGAVIATPSSPTTTLNSLSVGVNVFQWTISNGSCPPSTSTINIMRNQNPTLSNAGPNQSICSVTATLAGNIPAVGTGSWSLVSGSVTITTPTLASSGLTSVGLGSNVLQWTISNGVCSPSTSTVLVTRDNFPSTSNAGPSQTVCATSATMSANSPTVGTGIWSLVSGSGVATSASSPTSHVSFLSVGTNVFQWTISNGVCSPSTSTVAIVRNSPPTLANAGASQTICSTSATLNGNTPAVGTGSWTVVSGAGTITNPSLPNSGVTSLGAGTNIFQWMISNGTCSPSSATVAIVRYVNPTLSNAGLSQTVCATSATLSGNAPIVGTGLWNLVSGSGVITAPASPNSAVNFLSVGTNVFQWTITNGTCPPSSSTVAIVRYQNPTIANAGTSQTLCAGNATLSANTPVIGSGSWSQLSGTGLISSFFTPTTTISGISVGTEIYQWSISNGVCPASTATISIQRDAFPTLSNAGPTQTLCASNATLSGNTPVIGTGSWTVLTGGSSVLTVNSPTSVVNGITLGTNILQWTISNGVCPPSSSTMAIIQYTPPTTSNAGTNQTVCTSTATLNGNTALVGNGVWTLVSGAGTIASPSTAVTPVSGLGFGTNVFQWTISNGICPPSISTVAIVRDINPTASNAGLTQTICATTATLSGNSPIVGTGNWTLLSGAATINTPGSPNSQLTAVAVGTNVLQWTISNGVCSPSSSTVSIIRDDFPTIANTGTNTTICATSANLAGNTPTVGTGIWSVLVGTSSVSTPTLNNSAVTNLSVGSNIFQWTISNGVCPSTTATVNISRDDFPSIAAAGPSQSVCASTTATMAANTPTVGTGIWSVLLGGASITSFNSPTTTVTGLALGLDVLQWTISNGVCPPSISTVSIQVDPVPSISNAGPSTTICSTTAILAANTPTSGVGTWSVITGGSTITSVNSPNSSVSGLSIGTNVLQWTIVSGMCLPSVSTTTIQVDANPSISNAGPAQTICISTATTTMAANTPTVGTGLWSVLLGTGSINNFTSPTTGVTGLSLGLNTLQWTISNGVCPPSSSTLNVQVDNVPTIANAGTSQTICVSTGSTTLAGNTPLVGVGTWSVLSGSGTIASANNPNTTITGLTSGTTIVQWSIANGVCANSTATMSIKVDNVPTIANAGTSQTICVSTGSTTLTGNTPLVGVGTWSVLSGSGTIASANNPNTTITGLTTGTTIVQWSIANGVCANSTATMSIQVDNLASSAVVSTNQTICSTSSTISATPPVVGVGTWSVLVGGSSVATPAATLTTVNSLTIGINIFAWVVSSGVCPSNTATVSIQVDANPTIANAGLDQINCSPISTLNANLPLIGTGVWNVLGGGASVTSNTLNTSSVLAMTVGVNTFEWVISNGVCPPSRDTVQINVLVNLLPIVAGPDQFVCTLNPTLNATPHAVGTGTWIPLGGAPSVTTPTLANSTVTFTNQGTYTYVWSVGYAICPVENDTVKITTYLNPTASNAGVDQNICALTATLNGNIPAIGTATWLPLGASPNVNNPVNYTTTVNFTSSGTFTYVWSIGNGTCPTENDTVVVNAFASPSAANAGPNQTICSYTTNMGAQLPSIGSGTWIPLSAGSSTLASTSLFNSAVNVNAQGLFGFVWEVGNSSVCPINRDTVFIQTFTSINAGTAYAGPDITSDLLNNLMAASAPTLGLGTWSVSTGSGTFANSNDPLSYFSATSDGVFTLVWTVTNGVCPAISDTMILTINPMLIPQVITPNGDGSNDYFEVKSLQDVDGVVLTVFNRWGNEVYKENNYKKNFKGENNSGVKLSDDTYFYILEAQGKTYTGYFAIKTN